MNDNGKQQRPEGSGGPGNNPWMKSLLIWIAILLGLAIFVTMFDGRTTPASGSTIPYSAFLDKVNEGTVKEVTVSREQLTGTLSSGEKFRTIPIADPTLVPTLREKGVTISAQPTESGSVWLMLLYQSLPFLLFLGIAFFVIRQMQKNSG